MSEFEWIEGGFDDACAVANMARSEGFAVTEADVFGLGEGFAFSFWERHGAGSRAMFSGRRPRGELARVVARRLRWGFEERMGDSAWSSVEARLEEGGGAAIEFERYFLGGERVEQGICDALVCGRVDEGVVLRVASGVRVVAQERIDRGMSWAARARRAWWLEVREVEPDELEVQMLDALEEVALAYVRPTARRTGRAGVQALASALERGEADEVGASAFEDVARSRELFAQFVGGRGPNPVFLKARESLVRSGARWRAVGARYTAGERASLAGELRAIAELEVGAMSSLS